LRVVAWGLMLGAWSLRPVSLGLGAWRLGPVSMGHGPCFMALVAPRPYDRIACAQLVSF